jgi:hypothetical protein
MDVSLEPLLDATLPESQPLEQAKAVIEAGSRRLRGSKAMRAPSNYASRVKAQFWIEVTRNVPPIDALTAPGAAFMRS